MNGLDEDMKGMTITALTLWGLQIHHILDMYSKISAVKKMTLAQYNNDINLFFDLIESVKLQIDSKDPMHIQTMHLFAIFLFNSRMNCFHIILGLTLLLLRDIGRWTKKLQLLSHSWMMQAHTTLIWWHPETGRQKSTSTLRSLH